MNGMSNQTERANTKENVRPARKALRALTRLFVPPYQPKRPARKVAIVVPLSTRPALLPEEEVSLRHLRHFLGAYDKYLIAPAGAAIQRDGFNTVSFSPEVLRFPRGPRANRILAAVLRGVSGLRVHPDLSLGRLGVLRRTHAVV